MVFPNCLTAFSLPLRATALLSSILLFLFTPSLTAQQERCKTAILHEKMLEENPALREQEAEREQRLQKWIERQKTSKVQSSVVTLPVVVHVLWRTASENISDAQIQSQISVLNKDFRKLNSDFSTTPAAFQSVAADTEIEFSLAGITRTQTTVDDIGDTDYYHSTADGGKDSWDVDHFINIWVCDMGPSGILGFAYLPGYGSFSYDGIVIGHQYFGTTGTASGSYPYNKGRTATHEVGHYLGLYHIWGPGNGGCSQDDYVSDTPAQDIEKYGCPSYPQYDDCTSSGAGIQFVNYMDYVNDACMTMFTAGQKQRMLSALNNYRPGLLTSTPSPPSNPLVASVNVQASNDCTFPNVGSASVSISGGVTPYSVTWASGETGTSASNLSEGSQQVTVEDSDGASEVLSFSISLPDELTAQITQVDAVTCPGGSDGRLRVTAQGGTGSYSYLWSSGDRYALANGLSAGTYRVTVTDQNGCRVISSRSLAAAPSIEVSLAASMADPVCAGEPLTLSASGAVQYEWTQSSGALISTNNPYTIPSTTTALNNGIRLTATDDRGCEEDFLVYPDIKQVSANVRILDQVSCPGESDGRLRIDASGGTGPYEYTWNTGYTGTLMTGLPSGNYSVTVEDQNGCVGDDQRLLVEPDAVVLTLQTAIEDPVCEGGPMTIQVDGATDYEWSNSQGEVIYQANPFYVQEATTDLNTGISLQAYDNRGCPADAIYYPNIRMLSAQVSVQDTVTCPESSDGALLVEAEGDDGPFLYSWSSGSTLATATDLPVGDYAVTVSDQNGCTRVDAVALVSPPPVMLAFDQPANTPVCEGTLLSLQASGAQTYTWYDSQDSLLSTLSSLEIQEASLALNAGLGLAVVDDRGCRKDTLLFPDVRSIATGISIQDTVTCPGGSDGVLLAEIMGGTAPFSYNWSSGDTLDRATGLAVGDYALTVVDQIGCIAEAQANLWEPNPVVLSLLSEIEVPVCEGTPFGLQMEGARDYTWYDSQDNLVYVGNPLQIDSVSLALNAGLALKTVDERGCEKDTLYYPDIRNVAAEVLVAEGVSCPGESDALLAVEVSTGTAPFGYVWSTGDTLDQTANLAAGSYAVTVVDQIGCVTQAAIDLPDADPVLFSVLSSVDDPVCEGDAWSLEIGGAQDYTWYDSQGNLINTGNPLQVDALSLLWNEGISLEAIDERGCPKDTLLFPDIRTIATQIATQDTVTCPGANDGALLAEVIGGTGPFQFTWSTGDTSQQATGLSAGNYMVTVVDQIGCVADASNRLKAPEQVRFTLEAVTEAPICEGDELIFSADEAETYAWYDFAENLLTTGNTLSIQNVSVALNQGLVLSVTDQRGCQKDTLFNPDVRVLPELSWDNGVVFCQEDAVITLEIAYPLGGMYLGTGVTDNRINPGTLETGTYELIYDYLDPQTGCSNTDTNTIAIAAVPAVDLSLSDTLLSVNDASVVLNGGSPLGGTYSGTGVQNSSFLPNLAGIGEHLIEYSYTSPEGCTQLAYASILVLGDYRKDDEDLSLWLYPNPSAGLLNLEVVEAEASAPLEVRIYNVNGYLVYSQKFASTGSSFIASLDLSFLPAGEYTLETQSGVLQETKKILLLD